MDRPSPGVGGVAVSTFVVIPCSGAKADVLYAPARELYTGSFFRLALAAAERVDGAQVFVLSALHDTGLDPKMLELELTESTLIGQADSIRRQLTDTARQKIR